MDVYQFKLNTNEQAVVDQILLKTNKIFVSLSDNTAHRAHEYNQPL